MKNKIRDKINKERYITFYLLILLIMCVLYYLTCIITRGNTHISVFFGDNEDTFADFFKPLAGWHDNPYTEGICNYPALATLMFKLLYLFIPTTVNVESGLQYRSISQAWIPFILYNIVVFWMSGIGIRKILKIDEKHKNLFYIFILISLPVIWNIERGNQISLAFAFTLIFCAYYKSENKVLKELAFIALAIAAALKIYPAIFGLFLLKEKRIKDGIRTAIYGCACFFGPFIFYGKDAFFSFVKCLMSFSDKQENRYAYNYSIKSVIKMFTDFLNVDMPEKLLTKIWFLLVILMLVAFFVVKSKWQEWLCLSLLVLWIPSISDTYVSIFLLIPLIFFLNNLYERENIKIKDILYSILLGILFVPLPLPVISGYSTFNYVLTYSYLVYFVSEVMLGTIVGVSAVISKFQIINRKNSNILN